MVLRLHSISRWCYLHKVPFVPRMIQLWIHLFFKCVLPPECSIGPGTRIHRHGWCVGIDPNVEIGRDCDIYNLVHISAWESPQNGPPTRIVIGDRVKICSGAKVLAQSGTLTIGEGSTIAANAAVLSDVPAHALVSGVPARIVAQIK
jgi:serine O-acetyltransferase